MKMIETERLVIRNFVTDDWEALYEYLSQKEVLTYERDDVSNEADCRKKAIWRSQSNTFLAVCLKDSNKMIGHIYFCQIDPAEFMTWEIGYIFNPLYYGKGYATESCQKILQYGFEELGAHRIIGKCNTKNFYSWKLLERLSMRREGHFMMNGFFDKTEEMKPAWFDSYQYAILKNEWVNLI